MNGVMEYVLWTDAAKPGLAAMSDEQLEGVAGADDPYLENVPNCPCGGRCRGTIFGHISVIYCGKCGSAVSYDEIFTRQAASS